MCGARSAAWDARGADPSAKLCFAPWRTCGKPTCRCTRGQLHGPYLVRRFWRDGKQQKRYIRKADAADAMAGIEAWQQLHPPSWAMRQLLAELHTAELEVVQ